jgi:nucleotide-binding universal stress UspA family protein/predicted transcriptional regulator
MMDRATLLVPLDGSPRSEAALPYAEAIAEATGASLHVLSVVERDLSLSYGYMGMRAADMERRAAEADQDNLGARGLYLAGKVAALQAQGLTVSRAVVLGDPVDAILAAASQDDVTMVVMASRGRGAVGRMLVGSVADTVMRTGPRPTLLVRPQYVRIPPRKTRFEQLAVGLDGSPAAEAALPLAGELASATGATLYLVRVEPVPSSPQEDTTASARAYLMQAREQLPQSVSVETVVLQGDPAESLEELVVRERIDLMLMATRGRGGLRRLLLGSTAEALVRAGVPTLLLRTPAPVDEPASIDETAPTVTVGEIMSRPVVTAPEDATLAEIARLMLERGIGCVPLVDAQGKLSGVVTEVDLTGRGHYNRVARGHIPYVFGRSVVKEELEATYRAGQTLTAKEVMSGPIETATENELVVDIVQRMLRRERSCLLVTRDGALVGIVTRHDLLKMIVRDPTRP